MVSQPNAFLDEIIPIYSPLNQIISPKDLSVTTHSFSTGSQPQHLHSSFTFNWRAAFTISCLLITTIKFCFSQHLPRIPQWNCLQANPPLWSTFFIFQTPLFLSCYFHLLGVPTPMVFLCTMSLLRLCASNSNPCFTFKKNEASLFYCSIQQTLQFPKAIKSF